MSYGDNEYGVIVYGDDSIIDRIINIIGKIFALFKSKQSVDLFISPYKENRFLSSNP